MDDLTAEERQIWFFSIWNLTVIRIKKRETIPAMNVSYAAAKKISGKTNKTTTKTGYNGIRARVLGGIGAALDCEEWYFFPQIKLKWSEEWTRRD